MNAMRTLHAHGLTLVPQVAAHADAMFALLNDSAVYTYLDDEPPVSAATLRERFERLESRASADGREQWLNWAVQLDGGVIAGFVQATVCARGRAWVAFVLGQAHWGRGHAQHAARAMLGELSAHYGVTHALAAAERANRRSLALLARLGFALAPASARTEHDVAEHDVLMELRLDGAA